MSEHRGSIDLEVLAVLEGVRSYWGKKYCFPTQETIIRLLNERFEIKRGIRELNYVLRYLEDNSYLSRVRRTITRKDGQKRFTSTAYYILKKGYKLLSRMAMNLKSALYYCLDKRRKYYKQSISPSEANTTEIEEQRYRNIDGVRMVLDSLNT